MSLCSHLDYIFISLYSDITLCASFCLYCTLFSQFLIIECKAVFYIRYHRQPHDKYVHISGIIILSLLLDREFNSKVHSLSKIELHSKAF